MHHKTLKNKIGQLLGTFICIYIMLLVYLFLNFNYHFITFIVNRSSFLSLLNYLNKYGGLISCLTPISKKRQQCNTIHIKS